MEISRTRFTACLLTACVFSALFALGSTQRFGFEHRDSQYSANLYVFYETAGGSWGGYSGNVITDIGERYSRNILGFDNVTNNNATQWISLGNSTIADTKTELDTEAASLGFTRAANDTCAAWWNGTDYAYNVTKMFTATGTITINAAGLQWSGVSGLDNNLYALAAITQTTFNLDDNCTITWVITHDAND